MPTSRLNRSWLLASTLLAFLAVACDEESTGPTDAGPPDPAFESAAVEHGGKLVFTSFRDGNGEIYVMNADGTDQRNLTNHPAFDYFPPDWSPDGRRIAFSSNRAGNFDVYVMNADGSGVTRLTDRPENEGLPDWSPDGKRIAFAFNNVSNGTDEIYVMNADGTDLTRLADVSDFAPSWSRNGKRIAFTRRLGGPGCSVPGVNCEVYVMNADGTGVTRLTDHPALDTDPDWARQP